jgi:hypothetical protein
MQGLFMKQKQLGMETNAESYGAVINIPVHIHPQIIYSSTLISTAANRWKNGVKEAQGNIFASFPDSIIRSNSIA